MRGLKKIISNLREEDKAIEEICKAYSRAGFIVAKYMPIVKESKQVTDIDILAVHNNIVIIIEVRGKNDGYRSKILSIKDLIEKFDKPFVQESIIGHNESLYKTIYDSGFTKNRKVIGILFDYKKRGVKKDNGIHVLGIDVQIYFSVISSTALDYTKNEILDCLGISPNEVMENEEEDITEEAPAIINGILVERGRERDIAMCAMKVDLLLKRSRVHRYHGWKISGGFQRMLIDSKIKKMRGYLLKYKTVYPNDIIAVVSDNCVIGNEEDKPGEPIEVTIPNNFGALVIIDGQHRVVSFCQSRYKELKKEKTDKNDNIIKRLARDKHILLSIVKFKRGDGKKSARLFVDINTKQTSLSGEDAVDIREFIGEAETDKIKREILANKLIKKINSSDCSILGNKFKIEFYEIGKVPRKSLISYGGLSLFFKEDSNIKKIHEDSRLNLNFMDLCQKIIDKYFMAIFSAMSEILGEKIANEMIKDTSIKDFMFMSITSLAAFMRLLEKHFLYDESIKNLFVDDSEDSLEKIKEYLIPIFKEIKFTRIEWKKERFKSSQWADLEKEMVEKIRGEYSGFGNPNL